MNPAAASKAVHSHCNALLGYDECAQLLPASAHSLQTSEQRMEYYKCSTDELTKEIWRRGQQRPYGDRDHMSETLKKDDDARGSDATTVKTVPQLFAPSDVHLRRSAEFGMTALASELVGEEIVHWTMNTFFPTLQLFFKSERSCTIEGARLSGAVVGLDPKLRFRMTDITHEEEGQLVRTTLPEKFAGSSPSIAIRQATVACRTSIVVKPVPVDRRASGSPMQPKTVIVEQQHIVVGLQLEGMKQMAYISIRAMTASGHKVWGDMRITKVRDDVPVPFLGFPQTMTKPGGQAVVVLKESLIRDPS